MATHAGRRGTRQGWRVVCCWTALLCAGCATPPAQDAGGWRRVRIGLCEDYPEETRSLERAKTDLRLAKEAGASVLRVALGWDAIEAERGVYDWSFWDEYFAQADELGLRVIPYVCYTPRWAAVDAGENYWRSPPRDSADFRRFMAVVAARYRDRVDSWELWNEPDNAAYWSGSPDEFAALLVAGAAGVRTGDPEAKTVFGGIATEPEFVETVLSRAGVTQAIDVINAHSYFETWHPDPLERLPEYLQQVSTLAEEQGEGEPLWLAEAGYSSVGGRPRVSDVYRAELDSEHTETAQAGALVRTLLLALSQDTVELIAWYRINDLPGSEEVIGDDNNRHLGLRRVDGTPKPAHAAFAFMARLFAGSFRSAAVSWRIEGEATAPVHVQGFHLDDGRRVVAIWLGLPRTAPRDPLPDRRAARVVVSVPAGLREPHVFDATGRRVVSEGAAERAGDREWALSVRGGDVLTAVFER